MTGTQYLSKPPKFPMAWQKGYATGRAVVGQARARGVPISTDNPYISEDCIEAWELGFERGHADATHRRPIDTLFAYKTHRPGTVKPAPLEVITAGASLATAQGLRGEIS
jgi:hypothetical protein